MLNQDLLIPSSWESPCRKKGMHLGSWPWYIHIKAPFGRSCFLFSKLLRQIQGVHTPHISRSFRRHSRSAKGTLIFLGTFHFFPWTYQGFETDKDIGRWNWEKRIHKRLGPNNGQVGRCASEPTRRKLFLGPSCCTRTHGYDMDSVWKIFFFYWKGVKISCHVIYFGGVGIFGIVPSRKKSHVTWKRDHFKRKIAFQPWYIRRHLLVFKGRDNLILLPLRGIEKKSCQNSWELMSSLSDTDRSSSRDFLRLCSLVKL